MKTFNFLYNIPLFLLLSTTAFSQAQFDRDKFTQQVLDNISNDISGRIQDAVKQGEQFVFKKSYINEMLEPYREFGVNPDDTNYFNEAYEVYQKAKADPQFSPSGHYTDKIKGMLQSKFENYAKSFVDKESIAIGQQLQSLYQSGKQKVTDLLNASQEIQQFDDADPEIDTKITNTLQKYGFDGPYVHLIEDLENIVGQVNNQIKEPVEAITIIVQAAASKDPTYKIEALFNLGSKFSNKIPIIGELVTHLFDMGKEVLNAAKRLGNTLEQNFGQGCISNAGEFNSKVAKKQAFYQAFPHVNYACPMNQSRNAGIYRSIYVNAANQNELFFYINNKWQGGKVDRTHSGADDIFGLVQWLRTNGHADKAVDLKFIYAAYQKPIGFRHYQQQVSEKLQTIRRLTTEHYNRISHCEDNRLKGFFMQEMGLDWLGRLMSNHGGFRWEDARNFTAFQLQEIQTQMIHNRYISRHQPNLNHLDLMIEKLKANVPVHVFGKVQTIRGKILPGANIDVAGTMTLLDLGPSCQKMTTDQFGKFGFYLRLASGPGKSGRFTASSSAGTQSESMELYASSPAFELNFFLPDTDQQQQCGPGLTWRDETQQCVQDVDCSSIINTEKIFSAAQAAYVCVCRQGYRWNATRSACVPIDDPAASIDCSTQANTQAVWNDQLQRMDCACLPNFVRNSNGECILDVASILQQADCSQYPNTVAKWDYQINEAICDCAPGYQWNANFTHCEKDISNQLQEADCSGYPNTQASWDAASQEVVCDCRPGYVWNAEYTACLEDIRNRVANADCSGYPNSKPVWDPALGDVSCECLPGFAWNKDYTACIKDLQAELAQSDCSAYPNTRAVYDPNYGAVVCDCIQGYVWNVNNTGCVRDRPRSDVDWGQVAGGLISLIDIMNGGSGMSSNGGNTGPGGHDGAPPVVKHGDCNNFNEAGSSAREVHHVNLGQSFGTFKFSYDTESVPDQILVKQSGRVLFNTGCVGQRGTENLTLSGFSNTVTVEVYPNCDGTKSTAWSFTVGCPQ